MFFFVAWSCFSGDHSYVWPCRDDLSTFSKVFGVNPPVGCPFHSVQG